MTTLLPPACDRPSARSAARPPSRWPRWPPSRSVSAPTPRSSARSTACCCTRCRIPIPTAWSWSGAVTRRSAGRRRRCPTSSTGGRQARSFETLAAMTSTRFNVTGAGEPEVVNGGIATANLLHVFGVVPSVGRGFRDDEERGAAPAGGDAGRRLLAPPVRRRARRRRKPDSPERRPPHGRRHRAGAAPAGATGGRLDPARHRHDPAAPGRLPHRLRPSPAGRLAGSRSAGDDDHHAPAGGAVSRIECRLERRGGGAPGADDRGDPSRAAGLHGRGRPRPAGGLCQRGQSHARARGRTSPRGDHPIRTGRLPQSSGGRAAPGEHAPRAARRRAGTAARALGCRGPARPGTGHAPAGGRDRARSPGARLRAGALSGDRPPVRAGAGLADGGARSARGPRGRQPERGRRHPASTARARRWCSAKWRWRSCCWPARRSCSEASSGCSGWTPASRPTGC